MSFLGGGYSGYNSFGGGMGMGSSFGGFGGSMYGNNGMLNPNQQQQDPNN